MTNKAIPLKFVVPTAFAIALGIVILIGPVHFTDEYAVPIDQVDAIAPSPAAAELRRCRTLTGGFRAFGWYFPI